MPFMFSPQTVNCCLTPKLILLPKRIQFSLQLFIQFIQFNRLFIVTCLLFIITGMKRSISRLLYIITSMKWINTRVLLFITRVKRTITYVKQTITHVLCIITRMKWIKTSVLLFITRVKRAITRVLCIITCIKRFLESIFHISNQKYKYLYLIKH